MKKEIIIPVITTVVVGILVAGFYYFYSSQIYVMLSDKIDEMGKELGVAQNVENSTYTNSDYKFTLQFPGTWEGFEVVKQKTPGVASNEMAVYDVYLPTTDTAYENGKRVVFTLGVFSESVWKENAKSDGPQYEFIGITNDGNYVGFFPGTIEDSSDNDFEISSARIHPVTDTFKPVE